MSLNKWFAAIILVCFSFSGNCWSDNGTSTNVKDQLSDDDRQVITIQVSSFKKAEDAERELARFKSYDIDAFVSYEPVKDKGMWYRVYVGQFESKKAAGAFANGLVDRGLITWFWVKKTKAASVTVKLPETERDKTQETAIEVKKDQERVDAEQIQISPPPPPPIEIFEVVAPPEVPKPEAAEKVEIEEVLPEVVVQKEETPPVLIGAAEKDQVKNKFSIGLKSALSMIPGADEFEITRTTGGDSKTWTFQDTVIYGGLVAEFQFNNRFSIESSLERAFFTKLDLWQVSMGPKVQFYRIGMLTPFVRGGLVLGDLNWDDAPGDFDTGIGWDGGIGIHFLISKVHVRIDTYYRQIKYNYNMPSGSEYATTGDHLDLSGFALSGTLSYLF